MDPSGSTGKQILKEKINNILSLGMEQSLNMYFGLFSTDNLKDFIKLWKFVFELLKTLKSMLVQGFITRKELENELILKLNVLESDNLENTFSQPSDINEYIESLFSSINECINSVSYTMPFYYSFKGKTVKFDLNINGPDYNIYNIVDKPSGVFFIKVNNKTFWPDQNLSIRLNQDRLYGNLVYFGRLITDIDIQPNAGSALNIEVAKEDFSSRPSYVFPATEFDKIILKLQFNLSSGDTFKNNLYLEVNFEDVKQKMENHFKDYAESIFFVDENEESFEVCFDNDKLSGGSNYFCVKIPDEIKEVRFMNFMHFKIKLKPLFVALKQSLHAELTEIGKDQFSFLQQYLNNAYQVLSNGKIFYANFTSLIQSSGFGKSKFCLELLRNHPGLYFVFRKPRDNGIPQMSDWMKHFKEFIVGAKYDSLPSEERYSILSAMDHSPTRFLLALKHILDVYVTLLTNTLSDLMENSPSISAENIIAVKKESLRITSDKISDFLPNNEAIYTTIFTSNGYAGKHFTEIISGIESNINKIREATKISESALNLPFLIFLDELDVFDHLKSETRLTGVNIIRRGLHLLESSVPILVIAIGTNSDALDFSPSVKENSLRSVDRKAILPPMIISGNWDIFSSQCPYHLIKFSKKMLLNRALFNVLVSFGRPLWSSCDLDSVIALAREKLLNGPGTNKGSRLAVLMCRANLTVNVHHVLARSLIRSYMIIVNYVSTDAKDMKIGYSSEPVLAMASRTITKGLDVRVECIEAIKEFLSERALDTGRIVEAIFEYICLFAIDDSKCLENLTRSQITEPSGFETMTSSSTKFLLTKENGDSDQLMDTRDIVNSNYHIVNCSRFFGTLVGEDCMNQIENILSDKMKEAMIGTSHFVQLEKPLKSDFQELCNDDPFGPAKQNVIDRALLKVGVLRQCGYVMPPNYPGIDFILPVLIPDPDESKEGVYSFIAVQSKTSRVNLTECAFKMSAESHLVRCPIKGHKDESICIANNCTAYFPSNEIETICKNQVAIVFTANGGCLRNDCTTFVSLKNRFLKNVEIFDESESNTDEPERKKQKLTKEEEEKQRKLKMENFIEKMKNDILKEANDNFRDEINKFNATSANAKSFPEFFKDHDVPPGLQPDLIITRNLSNTVTVQKLIWCESDITGAIAEMNLSESEKAPGRKIIKSFTCIAINNVSNFEHLVSKDGITVIKEIIRFSASSLLNVDPLHLPIVKNSLLNGVFSPYYSLNPICRDIRGLKRASNPLQNYSSVFTIVKVRASIDECANGPVEKTIQSRIEHPTKFEEKDETSDYEMEE